MIEESAYLAEVDPVLGKVIDEVGYLPKIAIEPNKFKRLARSIVGQQLSSKAASTIWLRVDSKISKWDPQSYLALSPGLITGVGVSAAKERFIRGIAEDLNSGDLDLDSLCDCDEEDARDTLISIKGVGDWTADMFLMFSLAKPDIFSMSDAGLRRSVCDLYDVNYEGYLAGIGSISEKWSPHRSLACRYLWAWIDR